MWGKDTALHDEALGSHIKIENLISKDVVPPSSQKKFKTLTEFQSNAARYVRV